MRHRSSRPPVGEITGENWDDLIGTNLRAPLFAAQAAAPALKKTQGCIVNITDIHAERPLKNYVVYSIAKAGLVGLTRSLARELAPEVRVNAVAPGPILWPDDESFDELSRQRIISHTPLRAKARPTTSPRPFTSFCSRRPTSPANDKRRRRGARSFVGGGARKRRLFRRAARSASASR